MGPEQWATLVLLGVGALLAAIAVWHGPGWQYLFWALFIATLLVSCLLYAGLMAGR
jgi:hypothetical protein